MGIHLLERSRILYWASLGLRPQVQPSQLPKHRSVPEIEGHIPQVFIRGTDALRDDPMIVHPFVLMHLVDITTGAYVAKGDRDRPAVHHIEPMTYIDGALKKHTMCDYILPMATQPCQLAAGGQGTPVWNELLQVCDAYARFLRPELLLLFELVDINAKTELLPACETYHRIAWGFCRPLSPLGTCNVPMTPEETTSHRIQLYEYQPTSWLVAQQTKSLALAPPLPPQPTVYFQFLRYERRRYPSTLHVKFSMAPTPSLVQVHQRPMYAHEEEVCEPLELELHSGGQHLHPTPSFAHLNHAGARDSFSMNAEHLMAFPSVHCKRYPTELCLVPERILHRLHSGHGGCETLAFSHVGTHLAAACVDRLDEYPIRLYHIDTGVQEAAFYGHQGLVYALAWSIDDEFLLSASSDGSAKCWQVSPPMLVHSFYHPLPNFVYCVDWWTNAFGVTGALDGFVRIWTLESGTLATALNPPHPSRVNALRLDVKTQRLYSGDATGVIHVWQSKGSTFELIKTLKHPDLIGKSITSFQLHPKRGQLLVQAQPSTLLQFELRSYLLLNKGYCGMTISSTLVRSTFSPDGRFVASGSEDGAAYLFSSLNGQRIPSSMWGGVFFGDPLCDVAWSTSAHIAAVCSLGSGNPIIVLGARRDDPQIKDSATMDEERDDQQRILRRQRRLSEQVAALLAQDDSVLSAQKT
ncbi:jouberin [Achlya hypogyna]|uniref:Jouberin n=1 Tax=Achlya hypogyna TaxID=1202772 RepID=A0A1V9YPZ2_ACHHY|nr:jouberin [Achlya hypogyna]